MMKSIFRVASPAIVAPLRHQHGPTATKIGNSLAVVTVAAAAAAATATYASESSHCEPTKQYTNYYFPVPGTGEPTRILLMLSGLDWGDVIITGKEWPALKPTTKWGQMPVVKLADGREMTQTKAICRYFAKNVSIDGLKLYPSDPWIAFQVDEFIDTFDDINTKMASTFSIKDAKERAAARAAMFATNGTGVIFECFKKVEAQLPGDGHMVNGTFTLADVWAFYQVNLFRAGFLDGFPTEGWLEKLPKLKGIVDKVAAQPKIKGYYSAKAKESKIYTAHASGK